MPIPVHSYGSDPVKLWAEWKDKYPFHCRTTIEVDPTRAPGHHCSVVLETGIRTWGFRDEGDYRTFLTENFREVISWSN